MMNGVAGTKLILVVDDYADLAEITAEFVRICCSGNVKVNVAFDGSQALASAKAQPPDVVVLDIDMPLMSGLEAAIAIRTHLWHSPPLLVAMTGNPGRLVSMDVNLAFDVVLPKPIDTEKLVTLIDVTVGRSTAGLVA